MPAFLIINRLLKKEIQGVKNKQKETNKATEQVKTIDSKVNELAETARNAEQKAQQALNGQVFGRVVKEIENN